MGRDGGRVGCELEFGVGDEDASCGGVGVGGGVESEGESSYGRDVGGGNACAGRGCGTSGVRVWLVLMISKRKGGGKADESSVELAAGKEIGKGRE